MRRIFLNIIRKTLVITILLSLFTSFCRSQAFVRTSELMKKDGISNSGTLVINQDTAIDSLISRYIIAKGKLKTKEGTSGMEGYRIQIYYSSIRTAREESAKIRAKFIQEFNDLISYAQYEEPGWFIIRVGDYRTKSEGYKDLVAIRKEFPNAYLVPAIINFPDLIKK